MNDGTSEQVWASASVDAKVIARALRSITEGDVDGPGGIESLVMALSGDQVSGRASLAKQTYDGLYAVACAIDNLADAYRERTRRLC